jgi:hypothetical protein
MNNIRYSLSPVLKCESMRMFYSFFIWNVVTKSRIPKNGAVRIFDDKSKLQEDTFSYSYANFQPYSMK